MSFSGTQAKAPQAGAGTRPTGVGGSPAGSGGSWYESLFPIVGEWGTEAIRGAFGTTPAGVTVQGDYYGPTAPGTGEEGGQIQQTAPGFPWGWVIGGVAAGGLVIYLVTRSGKR